MLRLDVLPTSTRAVFEHLRTNDAMGALNMCLFGGTALALLIGHRSSEDLDFFCFEKELPKANIGRLIRSLREDGFHVTNTLDPVRITQARINGLNLDDYIQEFSINEVKVSFGTFSKGGESRRLHFAQATAGERTNDSFLLPSLNTLFQSKAVVLSDRVTSRDLFDLMVLVKNHGFTIADIVSAIQSVDAREANEAIAALEVLTGNLPLDPADPGFKSIGLQTSMDEIYTFFNEQVNAYEQLLAQDAVSTPASHDT